MAEYLSAVTALITGAFAIGAAIVAWKLKVKETAQSPALDRAMARRSELERLYEDIYVSFDDSIRSVRMLEKGKSAEELSRMSARVRLLALERIVSAFGEASSLLTEWSVLHFNAHPQRKREGDTITKLIQSPNPGAKYIEPEREAYEALQKCLQKLVEEMRTDLAKPDA